MRKFKVTNPNPNPNREKQGPIIRPEEGPMKEKPIQKVKDMAKKKKEDNILSEQKKQQILEEIKNKERIKRLCITEKSPTEESLILKSLKDPKKPRKNAITINTQSSKLKKNILEVTKCIYDNYVIQLDDTKLDVTEYKKFLKKYIQCMFNESIIYKLNAANLNFDIKKNFKDLIILEEDKQNFITEKSYNFNIMCFGKSLYYHIRYIYFILFNILNKKPEERTEEETLEKYNFVLFCDHETYNIYNNNLKTIENRGTADPNIKIIQQESNRYWGIFQTDYITFSNLLNKLYPEGKKNNFTYCDYELEQIHKHNVNIYFCVSQNDLMKGIGAKRSLMNYFHYAMIKDMEQKVKEYYNCMNLDDNITMIGNFTDKCKARNIAQQKAFTIINEEITNIEEPNTIELNECGNLSIYELYKKLKKDMDEFNMRKFNTLILGIQKGKASGNDNIKTTLDININKNYAKESCTVYKLTLQKPYYTHKTNPYNPFFTRFLEDMVFNALNKDHIKKSKYYFLRFGHKLSSKKEDIDFEDCFYDHLFDYYTESNLKGIESIFLMNIHYFYYYMNKLGSSSKIFGVTGNNGSSSSSSDHSYKYKKTQAIDLNQEQIIQIISTSKYSHNIFILYMLILLLLSLKDTSDVKKIFPSEDELKTYICTPNKDEREKDLEYKDYGFNKLFENHEQLFYDKINEKSDKKQLQTSNIRLIKWASNCQNDKTQCKKHYINTVKNIVIDFGLYKMRNKLGYLDFHYDKEKPENFNTNNNLDFLDEEYLVVKHFLDAGTRNTSIGNKQEKTKKLISHIKDIVLKRIYKFIKQDDRNNDILGKDAMQSLNFCKYCLTDDSRKEIDKYIDEFKSSPSPSSIEISSEQPPRIDSLSPTERPQPKRKLQTETESISEQLIDKKNKQLQIGEVYFSPDLGVCITLQMKGDTINYIRTPECQINKQININKFYEIDGKLYDCKDKDEEIKKKSKKKSGDDVKEDKKKEKIEGLKFELIKPQFTQKYLKYKQKYLQLKEQLKQKL
jgi:hypothetical protein